LHLKSMEIVFKVTRGHFYEARMLTDDGREQPSSGDAGHLQRRWRRVADRSAARMGRNSSLRRRRTPFLRVTHLSRTPHQRALPAGLSTGTANPVTNPLRLLVSNISWSNLGRSRLWILEAGLVPRGTVGPTMEARGAGPRGCRDLQLWRHVPSAKSERSRASHRGGRGVRWAHRRIEEAATPISYRTWRSPPSP
jgi:hypothetical protein